MEPLHIHLKMTDEQARARALELLQLVGITDGARRLEQYPHQLSGGMRQRVMIAIGLACNPKLIIADEPTTALDVTIQAQILELMKDLSRRLGIALIVITHNLGDRRALRRPRERDVCGAHRRAGHAPTTCSSSPRHPYTIGLMRSVPRLDLPRGVKLETIEGLPPDLRDAAAGLPLRAALPATGIDACAQDAAAAPTSTPGHASACIRAEEIAAGTLVRAARARRGGDRRCSRRPAPSRCSSVDHLKKYFTVKAAGAGFMSSRDRDREGGRRRLVPRRCRARRSGWSANPAAARPRSAARCCGSTSRPAARSASAAPTSRTPATPTCAACGARSR